MVDKQIPLVYCVPMKPVDPLALLAELAKKAGTQKALAARLKMRAPYLSDIMNGRRDVPASLLARLGLKRVTVEARDEK